MFAHRNRSGFTLIEVMVCIVLLGLSTAAICGVYASGLQAKSIQADTNIIDSILRSRMDYLLATHYDQLVTGTKDFVFDGVTYSVSWTVKEMSLADLTGSVVVEKDVVPETFGAVDGTAVTAKIIVLTVEGVQMSTIVTDHQGALFKI